MGDDDSAREIGEAVLEGDAPAGAAPAEPEPVAITEVALSAEPTYPPSDSVPRPPPPASLRAYATPQVDDFEPASGPVVGGTKIVFVGKSLLRVSIVRIGGIVAQTVGADEPRELRVLAPRVDRPGEVDITIENPFVPPVVLARAFRYERLAAPLIASVAPDRVSTKGGTELTVAGSHFVDGTVVLLDGKPAPGGRYVSPTTMEVKTQPGDDGKMMDVSVRNPDGQTAAARRAFVYDKRFG